MNLKFLIGNSINNMIEFIINKNYKLLAFIPNGRFLSLDLKRSTQVINTIFDVGANIGQSALHFNSAFRTADIHCFEPVGATYKRLILNVRKYSAIKCYQIALGEGSQTLYIKANSDSELNSLKVNSPVVDKDSIKVDVESANAFCVEKGINNIDLLKIDVEGFELEVLKGFDTTFLKQKVKFIYAEAGFDKFDPTKTYYSQLAEYLNEHDFIISGFYEPFRWGKSKLRLGFCNILFTNLNYFENKN